MKANETAPENYWVSGKYCQTVLPYLIMITVSWQIAKQVCFKYDVLL
jgi:hypothetical protein